MMTTRIKKTVLTLMAVCCAAGFAVLAENTLVADAAVVDEISLSMSEGAAVRITDENDHNGIKFEMKLSNEDYAKLTEEYDSLSFGMLIAPASYIENFGGLEYDTVFGTAPVYDYAVYDETTGTWVYSGNNGAIVEEEQTPYRIVNIVGDSPFTYTTDANNVYFYGSLTNVKDENIAREFIGRGYIAATKGTETVYTFADYSDNDYKNNIRSMYVVAMRAVADTKPVEEGGLSDTSKAWLTNQYIKNAKVLTDNTASPVTMYADTEYDYIPASGLGEVYGVYDEEGVAIDYTVSDGKISLSQDYVSSVETTDNVFVLSYKEGYKANKFAVNVSAVTEISTPADVLAMRETGSGYFRLTQDIDMSETTLELKEVTFNGILNGNGKTISNLTYSNANVSLFNTLSGTVKNLTLKKVALGGVQSGALARNASNATIDNVYIGIDFGSSNHSGGVVKYLESGTLSISNTVVNALSALTNNSGMLIGFATSSNVTLTNTYAVASDAAATIVGGRTGDAYNTHRDAINTAYANTIYTMDAFEAALEAGTITVNDRAAYDKITEKISVSTAAEFLALRSATSGYYKLTKDIDLSEAGNIEYGPMATFGGVLDGNGYTVSGMTVATASGTTNQDGFWRVLSGTVKNLTVVDATVGASGSNQGGLFAFSAKGATFENVYVKATVNGTYSGVLMKTVDGTVTMKNCVIVAEAATGTYMNGFFGWANVTAENISLTNTYFITNGTILNIAGRSDGSYPTNFAAYNTAFGSLKYTLADFAAALQAGTVTVKNMTAYNKIIAE